MKLLRPLILKDAWWKPIEKTINEIFDRTLFIPLRAALADAGLEVRNAKIKGLEKAIAAGDVYYDDGKIYGRFNASISKELVKIGAKYNKRSGYWKLPDGISLPAPIQIAIAHAQARTDKAIANVLNVLDNIDLGKNVDLEKLEVQYGTGLWRMNEDFVAAASSITVVPDFTPEAQRIISKEWAQNLDLYIKEWTEEAIIDLRQEVQSNVMRGQRSANLIKTIQGTHNVSKEKAKFLAAQETSLMMSKMREQRYKEIGINEYIWTGANDARERADHKVLNGTKQSWNSPPITCRTGKNAGARNHPGEDFGPCRCIAVGIIP